LFASMKFTGKVIFVSTVPHNFSIGDKLIGFAQLTVQEGDNIPSNSIIDIRLVKDGELVVPKTDSYEYFNTLNLLKS